MTESNMSSEMDHSCEYHAEYRTVETKYDSTKTFVIQTTQISVQVCETCGKEKPETPTDEFISIRSNYNYDIIMEYQYMEEGDVSNLRQLTCDWMNFIPMWRSEDPLLIRCSEIKETNCQCKTCNFLKCYVDFIDN